MFCCPFTILDGDFPLFPVPRIQKRSVDHVSLGHPYQTLRIYQRGTIFSIIWKYGNILFKYRLYSILSVFLFVLPCYRVLSICYSPISRLSETYPHNSPMIPPCWWNPNCLMLKKKHKNSTIYPEQSNNLPIIPPFCHHVSCFTVICFNHHTLMYISHQKSHQIPLNHQ